MTSARKRSVFASSLPVLARMYSENAGLKTVFGAPAPMIKLKEKVMYLPDLPFDADEETQALFMGFMVHEAHGHGKYTDPEAKEAHKDTFDEYPFLHEVVNAIEDPRIEYCSGNEYPGNQRRLLDCLDIEVRKGVIRDGSKGPGDALTCYLDYFGRFYLAKQTVVKEYLHKAETELAKYLDESGVSRLEALLAAEYHTLNSTSDVVDLSLRVFHLIDEIREEQENEQSQNGGKGSDPQAGQPGPGSSSGGDDKKSGDASNGKPSGSAGDVLGDDTDYGPAVDHGQALEKALDKEAKNNPHGLTTAGLGAGYGGNDWLAEPKVPSDNWDGYLDVRNNTSAQTAALRQHLINLVRAYQAKRRKVSIKGKLNAKTAGRALVGDERIFRRTVKNGIGKAALTLLVDISGSMSGEKDKMAQQAYLAVAEACDGIDVPLELLCFGASSSHPAGLAIVKPFSMPYQAARARIGGYPGIGHGGTPLAEGLFEAGSRLIAHPSKRKLLIALTDGHSFNDEAARDIGDRLSRSGVEVFGAGILSNAVENVFDRYVCINTLEELAPKILTLLSTTLISSQVA